jgi:hypothetical protein
LFYAVTVFYASARLRSRGAGSWFWLPAARSLLLKNSWCNKYSALYQVQISNACYQIRLCTNVLSTGLNVSSLVSNDCCLYLETICGSSHILYQNLGQMLMVYESLMYSYFTTIIPTGKSQSFQGRSVTKYRLR